MKVGLTAAPGMDWEDTPTVLVRTWILFPRKMKALIICQV